VVDARLLAIDDSVWRRPFHSARKSRHCPQLIRDASIPKTHCRWCCFTIRRKKFRSRNWRGEKSPYYTNTREGLRIGATHFCSANARDMKQIVMITDGKPSALNPRRRTQFTRMLRARSAGGQQTLEEVCEVQTGGVLDQYVHAGVGLMDCAVRPESKPRCAAARPTSRHPTRSPIIC